MTPTSCRPISKASLCQDTHHTCTLQCLKSPAHAALHPLPPAAAAHHQLCCAVWQRSPLMLGCRAHMQSPSRTVPASVDKGVKSHRPAHTLHSTGGPPTPQSASSTTVGHVGTDASSTVRHSTCCSAPEQAGTWEKTVLVSQAQQGSNPALLHKTSRRCCKPSATRM